MSSLSLLAAPLCLALVVGLLWLAAAAEQRLLSPRAVMAYSIRSRPVSYTHLTLPTTERV